MGRYRRVKKTKATGEVAAPVAGRKRKASSGEESVQRRNSTDVATPEKKAASSNSDEQLASSVSSDGSVELVNDTSKPVDLEVKVKEETGGERSETTPLPTEDPVEEADIMKFITPPSTPAPATTPSPPPAPARVVRLSGENSRRRQVTPLRFDPPTEAELEGILAKFKNDNKTKSEEFAKRYNYDIENDKPLEGRFEWEKMEP